ncbi:ABC transporter substrate-binding protein [Sinorhizobium meliloti]|uniref:ABC transporter substrate-binding protein n=1 Tax=Rhizobium meliloti TaxID=382 RepID=UPI000FD1C543|nr:sugar ABC transporter substrate-binding protein [Sinorhizobium meliloti]RVH17146.1 sugar ABC transporter substrate-binding protein [Sinorhizobium meliloti]RVK25688.1 sugar ABC transporter substrate-binding protein [Sinorhizobium meliloti]RVO30338.1 sugar ABC transporter substrate-binding protein [Sinorhizobium meliloti]RVO86890.1 sugar ABC transporter substrate-binding protein [Sinorhizobium meliloti]RVQ14347.1 sugar ABC transporter substrate-binding protein [Sinorhizobium meliloti]
MQSTISRRLILKSAGLAAAAAATGSLFGRYAQAQEAALSVFGPLPPDPAPPGAAKFAEAAFEAWKAGNGASVNYELLAWPQLHDRMATAFASGHAPWDVIYMCAWVPEFESFLRPFVDDLPADLIADLPESSFKTVTWNGKRYGTVFTLSLLTLFFNTEHLEQAGIKAPPQNWDEFKRFTKELTRDGRFGYVANYAEAAGIGGAASYWMAFLQQAGGTMYGEDGMPVFKGDAGVDALQMMIDLMAAGTEPGSISYAGINDASNVFMSGRASMMMNWPYMWNPAQDPKQSQIIGKLAASLLPAGPAGTASIDGTDAWTISKASANPEKARKLIEFYLDKDVQKRQALDTGWLPSRLSVLGDPEVQAALPIAGVVLEQAQHPYDSFVTPDFTQVSQAIGTVVQKALQGQKTAAEAIAEAHDLVTAIVKRRG